MPETEIATAVHSRCVYIFGAGVIARHHARAARKLLGCDELKLSVADPSAPAREKFATEFPDAKVFANPDEMLRSPADEGDIVIVATPPFTHRALTISALRSGRHVLCEKPFAMNAAEASEMLRAARDCKRYVACCSSRFLGQSGGEQLKNLLAQRKLGRLYRVRWISRGRRARTGIDYQPETPWFADRSRNGGGVLMDWSPYDFTMLNDILQPNSVEILHAWTAMPQARVPANVRVDVEFHVGATMLYSLPGSGKVPVTFERSSCTHGEEMSAFEFEGEAGAAQLGWTGAKNDLRLSRDEEGKPVTESISCEPHPLTAHERPFAQFLELIARRPSHAVANEQAVFNFHCLQAVYTCAETGRPQTVDKGKLL